jgi:hypothetical protein
MSNCKYCVNYRWRWWGDGYVDMCVLDTTRPLEPCDDYQREPGADDDLESARARLKQREREIRESVR